MIDSDIRITPKWLIDEVREFAAPWALHDVCTEPDNPIGADTFWTIQDDALTRAWSVTALSTKWANVPYSRGQVELWSAKIINEARNGIEILMLTKDDCRTKWNGLLRENCDARCRIERGVGFLEPDNGDYRQLVGPMWGSCLWYFGRRRRRFARVFSAIGEVLHGLGPQEMSL